ncbi:hypothetical protein Pta02_33580 [Planobispora takensis]|uniref:Uncharacterized protein n=1 Tax=Planobispora takensis TaxID=1367882 RepID=A0A8J3SZS4_9ACTN|nr:hypothetical protein Pta02_33580 [Planobispora takensis]
MGTGEATNRAFCAVSSAPPVSSPRRTAPAMRGTTLSAINPAGASHPALPAVPAAFPVTPAVFPAVPAALPGLPVFPRAVPAVL